MSRMAFLTRVLAFSQRRPAELVERGIRPAGVLLDEVEPLERHEELVFVGVAELHELLLGCPAGRQLLETDEPADAVVDVDDEVADLQVPELGDERPRRRPAPLVRPPLLFEQIGLGEDPKLAPRQMEATREHVPSSRAPAVFARSSASATERARTS